ncbi:MAG: glycine-rich domain-containing protein-like [Saccharospirillaceae bacterium]|nr:glycine-rich domain-containing protein-like [Saccharospirillaceae bacterium]
MTTIQTLPALVSPVHMLAEDLLPEIQALDFSHLRHKYTQAPEAEMTAEQWDKAELEYRRFLHLKKLYPGVSFVPSKQIDQIWHAHILDTKAYREDCQKIFGCFIDHYPYFGIYGKEDYSKLIAAFDKTIALYEKHFGLYPSKSPLNASRCGPDHACHAPSECACRVPGACK